MISVKDKQGRQLIVMNNYTKPILPPATIGILGGGQLGQMMALVAKEMGYKVGVLDPTPDAPAAQVADFQIIADYDYETAIKQLADKSDVLTYEFENVDQEAIKKVSDTTYIPQPVSELEITSNRNKEKGFLQSIGAPVTDYMPVNNADDLLKAYQKISTPAILKTAEGGYDGHGQFDINSESDLKEVIKHLDGIEWIYERKQPFVQEVSIMVDRDVSGKVIVFPLSENIHQDHILHTSIVPARTNGKVHKNAEQIAENIASEMKLVGVLGIEFFLMEDGRLLVNELAPRPHNSGHYTIEACNVSQFKAHILSICNLSLPDIKLNDNSVMVNLLGDNLTLGRNELVNHPNWNFHDYGKAEIKHQRKMGHITVTGSSIDQLLQDVKLFR